MLQNITVKKVVLGFLGLGAIGFLFIQIAPIGMAFSTLERKENQPITKPIEWSSPEAEAIARKACYDCHSNETKYPWYANIAPVSWLVNRDVNLGREVLNFSEYEVESMMEHLGYDDLEWNIMSQMPLPLYIRMHPEAELSKEEKQLLLDEIAATMDDMAGMEH